MSENNRRKSRWTWCALVLLAPACLTGCQVRIGGQTLPSPYYNHDDVQYFPPGHEFILQNEADQMQAQNAPPAAGLGAGAGQPPAGALPAPKQP